MQGGENRTTNWKGAKDGKGKQLATEDGNEKGKATGKGKGKSKGNSKWTGIVEQTVGGESSQSCGNDTRGQGYRDTEGWLEQV